jgi:2-oxoglutarate dehydrogenase E1 component
LAHLDSSQAAFTVCNSSLSEYGVLGFEYGYSLVNPRSLVIWEAQFGDFCNGAQVMIDQFIVSGERKWLQRSGLTLLLPHGYDGQGPEHSSGRPERFLQLCDDDPYTMPPRYDDPITCRQTQDCNIQVACVSTPANYFHVLRRQVHRDFRKPLALFTSKALLRHPLARSSLQDMGPNTRFIKVYPEAHSEALVSPKDISTVIFCTGQIYYTILKARELNELKHTAIVRLEQISPFPYAEILQQLGAYPNAHPLWVQEEPLNMGMWSYVEPRFNNAITELSKRDTKSGKKGQTTTAHHVHPRITVVARPPSAAVATGIKKVHHQEEISLMSRALFPDVAPGLKKVKKEVSGVPLFEK